MPLLDVRNLNVVFRDGAATVAAVRDVSFDVERGECLGVIGESGSGKTTLVKAVLRLLPRTARYLSGEVLFAGHDLLRLPLADLRRIRWKRLAMMPQSAMNSLNPVLSVGTQLVEAIRTHERTSRAEARARAATLLEMVGLPASRLEAFPHELSGGTKQRVCLAMAIALNPDLLIADEPTTALDVVLQRHILDEIQAIRRQFGVTVMLISHDISVVAENCDRVLVMYGGRVVETGPTRSILDRPLHPYTIGLRNAFPQLEGDRQAISIPGQAPDLRRPPLECVFAARCPMAVDACRSAQPPSRQLGPDHRAACWRSDEMDSFRVLAQDPETWMHVAPADAGAGGTRTARR
ncbi:MAG: ABC transporter ATP-binding protein [Gemmatimonadetes bacterium]|nr:ABC transporter ATP-binding protein [Gemmatimonadota bacterium]